jgi:hypothetical protein
VRAGAEIVIENGGSPAVVLRVAVEPRGRWISESIALARKHAEELGYELRMDAEFAADLEEIIRNREPRDTTIIWAIRFLLFSGSLRYYADHKASGPRGRVQAVQFGK